MGSLWSADNRGNVSLGVQLDGLKVSKRKVSNLTSS
jgi:hypothetical protein